MRSKIWSVIGGVVVASLVGSVYPTFAEDPFKSRAAGDDPSLKKIAAFALSKLGAKVGEGGCTHLVEAALAEAGAYPGRTSETPHVWGRTETVRYTRPGYIIQFEGCVFKNGGERYEFPHHTAIINSRTFGKTRTVKLLHQNIDGDIKKSVVRETELNLDWLTEGKYWIYSPVTKR